MSRTFTIADTCLLRRLVKSRSWRMSTYTAVLQRCASIMASRPPISCNITRNASSAERRSSTRFSNLFGEAALTKQALTCLWRHRAAWANLRSWLAWLKRAQSSQWVGPPPHVVYFFVRQQAGEDTPEAFLQAVNSQLLAELGAPGGTPGTMSELEAQFTQLWAAVEAAVDPGAPPTVAR